MNSDTKGQEGGQGGRWTLGRVKAVPRIQGPSPWRFVPEDHPRHGTWEYIEVVPASELERYREAVEKLQDGRYLAACGAGDGDEIDAFEELVRLAALDPKHSEGER